MMYDGIPSPWNLSLIDYDKKHKSSSDSAQLRRELRQCLKLLAIVTKNLKIQSKDMDSFHSFMVYKISLPNNAQYRDRMGLQVHVMDDKVTLFLSFQHKNGDWRYSEGNPSTIIPELARIINFNNKKLTESMEQSNQTIWWHGGRLDNFWKELQTPKKGKAEHGPGLYLSSSYWTARKYAKGGKSTYKITLSSDLRLIENVTISLADGLDFCVRYLGGKGELIANDLKRYCLRMKTEDFPASVLNNLVVNHNAATGKKGLSLLKFLIGHGVDADIFTPPFGQSEQWVVVFNPKIIQKVQKVSAKEVTGEE